MEGEAFNQTGHGFFRRRWLFNPGLILLMQKQPSNFANADETFNSKPVSLNLAVCKFLVPNGLEVCALL
jgi:hypothetical protein